MRSWAHIRNRHDIRNDQEAVKECGNGDRCGEGEAESADQPCGEEWASGKAHRCCGAKERDDARPLALGRYFTDRCEHHASVAEPEAERHRRANQLPRLIGERKGDQRRKRNQTAAHDDESTRPQLSDRKPDRHLRCTDDEESRNRDARQ